MNHCHCEDPVISTHFPGEQRLPAAYSCKPRSAVQPCAGGSRYGRCSGQSADFMWQWIHNLVRCLNKNASVQLSLYWNPQVLIFLPQVRQTEKTAEWAVHPCHSHSPFVTFLIHKPTQRRHFHPFPYVCHRSWELPSLPKQNKSSTVRSTHSWASDTTCSTGWSLCLLCFTLSLTEEEDMERTSESKTRACPTRMLVLFLSLCVYFCSCVGKKWALLIEGSISFPCQRGSLASWVRLPVSWSVSPLSADCDGSARREEDIWLWLWDWQERKACIPSHQLSILLSPNLSNDFIPAVTFYSDLYSASWPLVWC